MKYNVSKWNLKDLVKDEQDLERIMSLIKHDTNKLKNMYSMLKQEITIKDFLKILNMLENMYKNINVINAFASLSYVTDTQSDEKTLLMTQIKKFSADIYNELLYFDLWWMKINEKTANRLIKNTVHVSEYLIQKRKLRKHTLSEKEEKIINILNITGISAITKLYEKITNSFRYKIKINKQCRELTRDEISSLFRDPNKNVRKKSYVSLLNKFQQNKTVLSDIYQNIVLNWKHEGMEIRKFNSPISIRNIENNIDDEIIKRLIEICEKKRHIFQDFFSIKAKLLKIKKIDRYDLYAPIRSQKKETYNYNESIKLIFNSIKRFDLELFRHAKKIIDSDHIDSIIKFGKKEGAFCSSIYPGMTPYILINFTGELRDVFTLSHELGHAIHGQICKKPLLVYEPTLPLAETASTFVESLLYDELINQNANDTRKKTMLIVDHINDLYATIMRQAFFTKFEVDAHDRISNGITTDKISNIYLQNLKTQFGNNVNVSNDFSVEWCAIPHFFHTPFYCYAYVFGSLLSLSLFQKFKENKKFSTVFIDVMREGGSKKPEVLLQKHGMNINTYGFWENGFNYIENQIELLKEMC